MSVYNCSIRDITAEVGAAVVQAAVDEDLAEGHGDVGPKELAHMSKVWPYFQPYPSLNKCIFFLVQMTTKHMLPHIWWSKKIQFIKWWNHEHSTPGVLV